MGFANKMPPDVSEGILRAEHESQRFLGSLITDLHSDFKNSINQLYLRIGSAILNLNLNIAVEVYKN